MRGLLCLLASARLQKRLIHWMGLPLVRGAARGQELETRRRVIVDGRLQLSFCAARTSTRRTTRRRRRRRSRRVAGLSFCATHCVFGQQEKRANEQQAHRGRIADEEMASVHAEDTQADVVECRQIEHGRIHAHHQSGASVGAREGKAGEIRPDAACAGDRLQKGIVSECS